MAKLHRTPRYSRGKYFRVAPWCSTARRAAAHALPVRSARSRMRPMRRASLDFHARCATPVRRASQGVRHDGPLSSARPMRRACRACRTLCAVRMGPHATRVARLLFSYALHVAHGPSFRMEGVRHARPIMPQTAHSRRRVSHAARALAVLATSGVADNPKTILPVTIFRVGVKL